MEFPMVGTRWLPKWVGGVVVGYNLCPFAKRNWSRTGYGDKRYKQDDLQAAWAA